MGIKPDTGERLLRGGIGSSLVHAALLSLLLLPQTVTSDRVSGPAPALRIFQATVAAPQGPRRDPDLPFRGKPSASAPQRVPLSLENGPHGADFNIDLARIRERRNDLFPFVTWNLDFLRGRPGDRGGALEFHPDAGVIPPAGGPPLALSAAAAQAIIDRAWSRRHRWSNLQELVSLADHYNADHGDLPVLFREYLRQNIPQPYEDWSDPDPVFWITLMLAADDAPLVEFVGKYVRRHPASRVTTELLFLLDTSADSSCDVLSRVLRVGSPDLPLAVTQLDNPDAYDLAASLSSAYLSWVVRHRADLRERCTGARIAILRRIIDTSPDGYGASDARFLLGQALWHADRQAEAVEWWRDMRPDDRNQYSQVQRALRGALAEGAAESNPSRLTGILRDEEQRWRIAAGERLEHFGERATEF